MKTVSKAGKDLMINEPFYGFYLLHLNKKFSEKLPTAGVYMQGINIGLDINKKFWYELSENVRTGVLKHELLHICFFHLHNRDRFADPQLFNIAADLEINQHIKREDLPKDGMFLDTFPTIQLEKFKGTQYYYEKLRENLQKPKNPNNQCSCQNKGQGQGQDGEDESNSEQGKSQGKEDNSNQGSGNSSSNVSNPDCPVHGSNKGTSGSSQQGNSGNGSYRDEVLDRVYQKPMHETWKLFDELSEAEKKLVKQQADHVLKEAAKVTKKSHGHIPGELKQYIDELLKPKETVFDWKSYLRRFMGGSQEIFTRKTRRKLSKRFTENPGLKIKKKKHILIAVDTSGSINQFELGEFFSEIYHIYKTGTEITIVECDAQLGDIYKYKGKFRGHISGGGGTSFDPVIEYFNERSRLYTSLIYFTDGYAGMPRKPNKQMMWVISSNGRKDYNNTSLPGITIQIPETSEKSKY